MSVNSLNEGEWVGRMRNNQKQIHLYIFVHIVLLEGIQRDLGRHGSNMWDIAISHHDNKKY
jgi:hypothetical protein